MRLNHLTDLELLRYWRIAYQLLVRYQSVKAFNRLGRIVLQLDRRGL